MTDNSHFSSDAKLLATAQIVSALVAQGEVRLDRVQAVMAEVHAKLLELSAGDDGTGASGRTQSKVEETVQPDYLVCLEDGKRLKMLKRYLKTNYNMTPEEYRKRWNLPANYPMVAPEYAKRRSQLAKQIGLGRRDESAKELRLA